MTAEQAGISGNMSISDYDVLTGGVLSAYEDPYTAGDEGRIKNTSVPGKNSATYTPPVWLSARYAAGAQGKGAAQNVAPLINGQPASGPADAGQPATGNRK